MIKYKVDPRSGLIGLKNSEDESNKKNEGEKN